MIFFAFLFVAVRPEGLEDVAAEIKKLKREVTNLAMKFEELEYSPEENQEYYEDEEEYEDDVDLVMYEIPEEEALAQLEYYEEYQEEYYPEDDDFEIIQQPITI